jgi:hypothetical protein
MRNPAATPQTGPPTLARGVYREPVLNGGRPVLIAVTSNGERIATRTLGDNDSVREAVRELTALLDRFDPWPRIRLVTDADIAASVEADDCPKRLTVGQLERIYIDSNIVSRMLWARKRAIQKGRSPRHAAY